MPCGSTSSVVAEVFKMAERSDGCSGETLLAPCACWKKKPQRNITKDYYWVGAKESIGIFNKL